MRRACVEARIVGALGAVLVGAASLRWASAANPWGVGQVRPCVGNPRGGVALGASAWCQSGHRLGAARTRGRRSVGSSPESGRSSGFGSAERVREVVPPAPARPSKSEATSRWAGVARDPQHRFDVAAVPARLGTSCGGYRPGGSERGARSLKRVSLEASGRKLLDTARIRTRSGVNGAASRSRAELRGVEQAGPGGLQWMEATSFWRGCAANAGRLPPSPKCCLP